MSQDLRGCEEYGFVIKIRDKFVVQMEIKNFYFTEIKYTFNRRFIRVEVEEWGNQKQNLDGCETLLFC